MADGVPALYRGLQHETVRWDLATWKREHAYGSQLAGVHQAGFTRGEDWLVLAGVAGGTAKIEGKIELVDLRSGVSWLYKANTSHATAVLLPSAVTVFGIFFQWFRRFTNLVGLEIISQQHLPLR